MSGALVSAEDINREHGLARQHAESAVQHAIRCGKLLTAKKCELTHGSFQAWIAANCDFQYSTAARYMKAAKVNLYGTVEISTLSKLFPSGSKAISASTTGEVDLSTLLPVPDALRVPLQSGNVTLMDISGTAAMVLFESHHHPGFWYDMDLRDGTTSKRPCRPEMLQYRLANDATASHAIWSLWPDDGAWCAFEDAA
jgi:hypothetical protein